jgi:hypothetical protein
MPPLRPPCHLPIPNQFWPILRQLYGTYPLLPELQARHRKCCETIAKSLAWDRSDAVNSTPNSPSDIVSQVTRNYVYSEDLDQNKSIRK